MLGLHLVLEIIYMDSSRCKSDPFAREVSGRDRKRWGERSKRHLPLDVLGGTQQGPLAQELDGARIHVYADEPVWRGMGVCVGVRDCVPVRTYASTCVCVHAKLSAYAQGWACVYARVCVCASGTRVCGRQTHRWGNNRQHTHPHT